MTSYGSREDWKHDDLPAPRATPRDVLRLHLKEWEVPTCPCQRAERTQSESRTDLHRRRKTPTAGTRGATLPVESKTASGSQDFDIGDLRRGVRRSRPYAASGITVEHNFGTGHHLLGYAGSHHEDGIGRTRAGTAVCHPGAEADCGVAAGATRYHHRDPVVPRPQRYCW